MDADPPSEAEEAEIAAAYKDYQERVAAGTVRHFTMTEARQRLGLSPSPEQAGDGDQLPGVVHVETE